MIIIEIVVYLALCFGWTYFFWGKVALHSQNIIEKQPDAYLHLGGFGPLLSASLCSFLFDSFPGFWSGMYTLNWRENYYLYQIAFGSTFLITTAGFLLSIFPIHLLKSPARDTFHPKNIGIFFAVFFFCMIMIIGEESGWRGYLLPRLVIFFEEFGYSHPKLLSSCVLGIIWSLWHLPIFYWKEYPLVVDGYRFIDIVTYQISYSIGLSGVSAIMTWIFYETQQSIIGMLIIHSCLNATAALFGVKRLNNLFLNIGLASLPLIYFLFNNNLI